jgi:hypothetical protein
MLQGYLIHKILCIILQQTIQVIVVQVILAHFLFLEHLLRAMKLVILIIPLRILHQQLTQV